MSNNFHSSVLTGFSFALLLSVAPTRVAEADTSELWGERGELWDPSGRLPDFSYAGYKAGREAIPDLPVVTNVRDFGAVGDGTTDDTAAFQAALAATQNGALLVPAGRYILRGKLEIQRSNVVIRGEGPAQTEIYIDRSLTQLNGGVREPAFSYGHGFFDISSSTGYAARGSVVAAAKRGDRRIQLDSVDGIEPGDVLRIRVVEPESGTSLGLHLHNDQEKAFRCGDTRVQFNWRVVVARVDQANLEVELDEPLPIDLRLEWGPVVGEYQYISDVGIEDLAIEFQVTTYPGHLQEFGYNAIIFDKAIDSWVRNVHISNADNGVFLRGKRLTVRDVAFFSSRPTDAGGSQGHHAVGGGHGSLVQRVQFNANYVHHITVSNQSNRNVFSEISGTSVVRLDHHRRTPIENLFTNFSASWNYRSGGSGCEGPHAGARNSYWGMKGPAAAPCNTGGSGQCWGHIQSNLVGDIAVSESLTDDREWYEDVAALKPRNLYQAQLKRRLAIEDRDASFSELPFGSRTKWSEHDIMRWAVVEDGGDTIYGLITTVHQFKEGQRLGEYALATTDALGDASITARVKSPEPLDARFRDLALILGYQDDDNYDYAMFNSDAASTEIFAVRDGQRHSIANAERDVLTDSGWHDAGFRRTGTVLEMFWNGELIATGDLADAGFVALPGQVGIGSYNDEAYFDDVAVESPDLKEEEPDGGPFKEDSDGGPPKEESDGGPSKEDTPPDTVGAGCGCNVSSSAATGFMSALFCLLCLGTLRQRQ